MSPLVKKYNSRDSGLSESSKNSRESMWGVRDFEDVLAGSGRSEEGERDDEEGCDELERMIGNIML